MSQNNSKTIVLLMIDSAIPTRPAVSAKKIYFLKNSKDTDNTNELEGQDHAKFIRRELEIIFNLSSASNVTRYSVYSIGFNNPSSTLAILKQISATIGKRNILHSEVLRGLSNWFIKVSKKSNFGLKALLILITLILQ